MPLASFYGVKVCGFRIYGVELRDGGFRIWGFRLAGVGCALWALGERMT